MRYAAGQVTDAAELLEPVPSSVTAHSPVQRSPPLQLTSPLWQSSPPFPTAPAALAPPLQHPVPQPLGKAHHADSPARPLFMEQAFPSPSLGIDQLPTMRLSPMLPAEGFLFPDELGAGLPSVQDIAGGMLPFLAIPHEGQQCLTTPEGHQWLEQSLQRQVQQGLLQLPCKAHIVCRLDAGH